MEIDLRDGGTGIFRFSVLIFTCEKECGLWLVVWGLLSVCGILMLRFLVLAWKENSRNRNTFEMSCDVYAICCAFT